MDDEYYVHIWQDVCIHVDAQEGMHESVKGLWMEETLAKCIYERSKRVWTCILCDFCWREPVYHNETEDEWRSMWREGVSRMGGGTRLARVLGADSWGKGEDYI